MQMQPLRITFEKKGRAKYISHLDMTRCMQRALKRAKLPIWYTEGFNPHLYLTFALPLSLGYESDCEYMDVRLIDDVSAEDFVKRFNEVLPQGLTALSASAPINKPEKIKWADYKIDIFFENATTEELKRDMEAFTELSEITVLKKTKKGEKEIDIKPLFEISQHSTTENCLSMSARFASGINLNINPSLMINEFAKRYNYQISHTAVKRIAIITEDGKVFS